MRSSNVAMGNTAGSLPISLERSLGYCCKNLNYSMKKIRRDTFNLTHHDIDPSVKDIPIENDTITLFFPVLANKNTGNALNAHQYLPIKNSPGPMVLANKNSLIFQDVDMVTLLTLAKNPMLIFCLAMASSAAVVFWLLEFHNKEKSSSPLFATFVHEIGQSMWFSIVTMTTVGYGDIVPRSPLARCYTVLWMFVGMILTSLFTAHVSSSMTSLHMKKAQNLIGRKMGVMHGMKFFFDTEINTGAIITEYSEDEMYRALAQGNVSRIILPDFLEAMYLMSQKYGGYSEDITILDTIKHPFSVGLTVLNVKRIDEPFMSCLRVMLIWEFGKEANIDYAAIDMNEVTEWSVEMMSSQMLCIISYYVVIISAVLLVLGVIKMILEEKYMTAKATTK